MDKRTEEAMVVDYWTRRAHDFGLVRKNELADGISGRWLREMGRYLPPDRTLEVLDVGTGTGYFAILLAAQGHRVTGIDLTPAMLREAEEAARTAGVTARFLERDAQATGLPEGSFDAVVTRNLTWTLPDPAAAYGEWARLLRPGGVLLNFDADYAENVRRKNQRASWTDGKGVYGHTGITPELSRMNAEITLAMPASRHRRPDWDLELMAAAGFAERGADLTVGKRILEDRDLPESPLFLVWGRK
jgi:ubiquinone/menaquinone biosynthesis C-methylase UbiE